MLWYTVFAFSSLIQCWCIYTLHGIYVQVEIYKFGSITLAVHLFIYLTTAHGGCESIWFLSNSQVHMPGCIINTDSAPQSRPGSCYEWTARCLFMHNLKLPTSKAALSITNLKYRPGQPTCKTHTKLACSKHCCLREQFAALFINVSICMYGN